ncbi:MAG: hypothetical protein Tsb0013_04760 [Phycisphaerales bacterium]
MPHTVTRFETTPNPRAMKCLLSPAPAPVGSGLRSYSEVSAARAAEDELACVLLEIDGVERVMVLQDFVTVTRREDAKWSALKPALKRALGTLA